MSKPYSKAVIFEAWGLKKKLARFHQETATNNLAIDASFGDEFVVAAGIQAENSF